MTLYMYVQKYYSQTCNLTTFTTTIRTAHNNHYYYVSVNVLLYSHVHVHVCVHVHVVINTALSSSERRLRSSPWEKNFLFPLCFLTLLDMTVMALFLVTANTLQLLYNRASVISVQVSHCTCICSRYMYMYSCYCMYTVSFMCSHYLLIVLMWGGEEEGRIEKMLL